MADERRLRVAMTRSKEGLIIVGNIETLCFRDSESAWTDLSNFFKKKWFTGDSFDLTPPTSRDLPETTSRKNAKSQYTSDGKAEVIVTAGMSTSTAYTLNAADVRELVESIFRSVDALKDVESCSKALSSILGKEKDRDLGSMA